MNLIITAIFVFLILAARGQVNDADAFFNGSYDKSFIQKHRIRQVIVQNYIDSNKSTRTLFDFDQDGLLIKQAIVDKSGKKVNDYLFTYNSLGDRIERKKIDYQLNKTYITTFTKIYKGSQLIWERSDEVPYLTKHIYNSNGKRMQSTVFLQGDTLQGPKRIYTYTYDREGRLKFITDTYSESSGTTPVSLGGTEYIYDAAGNVISVIREEKANYEFTYKNGLLETRTAMMPEEFNRMKMVDIYKYSFWE